MQICDLPQELTRKIREGVAIPAVPLALTESRDFDCEHQKALLRYYIDAGAGGIAVGVHSTQFEIREPDVALFEPVLEFCATVVDEWIKKTNHPGMFKIAGVCGSTRQALKEAEYALSSGYHASLLSLSALKDDDIDTIISHCSEVSKILPIVGFYLQPAVGGRVLSYEFWRRFAEIENVIAIKIAPFNRYQTFDVVRAVCEAGRESDIALYTGNDDNILVDLLTEYEIQTSAGTKAVRIVGGLLGHWAVWTKNAVEIFNKVKCLSKKSDPIPSDILTLASQITDCNAVVFDAANSFNGCIPGIHEILRRQGLMKGIWCLDPELTLSDGQAEEIDRLYRCYPHLNDDSFVAENLEKWLSD